MLGDAAGLPLADVGLTDRVQQSGLAVVDVTHDGHHRRPGLEVFLAALVLAVGEVEGLQQLAVLVLRGHDLHDVVHLAAEQFERLVADGLRRSHHLAEVEQRLHQGSRVRIDLFGEVAQRGAAGEPDGLAIAVRQPHAADDGRLHVFVFGAFRPLRLASALGRTAGTTERARRATALAGTTAATGTTAITAAAGRGRGAAATAGATAAVITATAATGTAGATTAGPAPGPRPPGPGRGPPGRPPPLRHLAVPQPDAEACCPATCRAAGLRAAGRPDGVPADAESAARPAVWDENGIVADARRPRGGLGRTGHRAGPGTGRSAGSGARLSRRCGRRRRRSRRSGCRRRRGCARAPEAVPAWVRPASRVPSRQAWPVASR